MATTDTQLSQLVINVGSKSQIEAAIQGGTITTNMLSFTTDGDDYLTSEDVTSTYSATGTAPVNGTAVASAISTKQDVLTAGTDLSINTITSGKNKFDVVTMGTDMNVSLYTDNYISRLDNNSGVIVPILPNTTYTVSTAAELTVFRIGTYPTIISKGDSVRANAYVKHTNNNPITFTSAANDRYLYIQVNSALFSTALTTLQVEEGTTATTYTAYQNTPSTVITFTNDTGYITKSVSNLTYYTRTSNLATVATSGSYNDLSNKPTIPTVTSTYSATGTDAVNGTAVASAISGKQDTLVSGTSIKTINSTSLLGSGDIAIDGLPSQTGNSGKFLTTDGTDASWATINALQNTATGNNSLTIEGTAASLQQATNVGKNSKASLTGASAFGYNAQAVAGGSVCFGRNSNSNSSAEYSISIGEGATTKNSQEISIGMGAGSGSTGAKFQICVGYYAAATAIGAYQFGYGTNTEAGTVCFALNTDGSTAQSHWTNYKLLHSDGTIPEARLADTTSAAQGQVLTLDSNLNAIWASASGGASTLSDLTDTTISNPSNGQILVYDSSSSKWVNQAQSSGGINYAGSVAYASLPTPAAGNVGNIYNITDAFTTDSRFLDGASKIYPAGTNVLVIEDTGTVTAYYGWHDDRRDTNRWTTSATPAVGDKTYYIQSGEVTENNPITSVSSNSITTAYFTGDRDSSLDTTISTPGTGYFFDVFMGDMTGYQTTSNLVTSVSSASTDTQYPSAKLFYDTCGDIESLINAL